MREVTLSIKKIPVYFGQSETDRRVIAWATQHNIDINLINGYTITRNSKGVSEIQLTLHYEDAPVSE